MNAGTRSEERSNAGTTTTAPQHAIAAAVELLRAAKAAGSDALDPATLARVLDLTGLRPADAPTVTREVVEFRVGVRFTREFGLVLGAGLGGIDATLDASLFGRGCDAAHAALELTDAADLLAHLRRTLPYRRMLALARLHADTLPDQGLITLLDAVQAFASACRSGSDADCVLAELTLDCRFDGATIAIVAGRCRLREPVAAPHPRPLAKIDALLHPRRIGIVGVSAGGLNFGRIILRNLLGGGCPPERLRIIRPGESEIDGVRCLDSLSALDEKLDLLIVAVAANAVPPLVEEIISTGNVNAVMLIPGGLGETAASRAAAAALAERIDAAHADADGGPVFLGANCLGVVSHPGGYDSWFIPLERLPKPPKRAPRDAVMLSQSGAFMITRLSHNPWLDPRYMVAVGNQTDLTHGDLLAWFAERDDVNTIGVYVEGFKDLDGLAFARAVRRAVMRRKQVIVYKAGRSTAGQAGVMGHTASIAGDPLLFASVLRQAGAIVTDDVEIFDDLFYMAGCFHHKTVRGGRLAAASGAGFEAVSAADAVADDAGALEVAPLGPDTVERVEAILVEKKLAALVEVRNPLDMNPGADDDAHVRITEAFAADPDIDAVVVGLDPTAPMVRALEQSRLRPGHDISAPESTVHTLPPLVARHDKPIVAVVDAGQLYDAMTAALKDQGVCVFRNVARATRALSRYVDARLATRRIRKHFGAHDAPTTTLIEEHLE
ncbi:CoA-binding protein [Rhodocyclaceae bacterium SMB388]